MRAITKILVGGVALTAVASAAPAAAQYYPGNRYGLRQQYGGNVVGQVLNDVLGNGYGKLWRPTARSRSTSAPPPSRHASAATTVNSGYGNNGYANRRSGARHQPGRAALERWT